MHHQTIILSSNVTHKSVRIILGLEKQLVQIRRFCNLSRNETTVFGIDRTFGLSSLFATTTVIKQLDCICGRSQNHPILLELVLLSYATEETYINFLNQLKLMLKNQAMKEIMFNDECFVLGSDQEKAFVNAMRTVCPKANRFVCMYSISKNIQDKLRHFPVSKF